MLRDYITTIGEKPDNFTGTDEVWETYYIYTSVMKPLSAMRNMCQYKCSDGGNSYTICKAEAIISALLEETGRRDRFMKWQMHDEMKDMETEFERSIAEGIKSINGSRPGDLPTKYEQDVQLMNEQFLSMIVTLLLSKESERLGLISAGEHKKNIETIRTVMEKTGR